MPWLHGFAFLSQSDGNPTGTHLPTIARAETAAVASVRVEAGCRSPNCEGVRASYPRRTSRYAWPGSRLVLEGSELTCSDIVTVAKCSGRGG